MLRRNKRNFVGIIKNILSQMTKNTCGKEIEGDRTSDSNVLFSFLCEKRVDFALSIYGGGKRKFLPYL